MASTAQWKIIYMTKSEKNAQMIVGALSDEGILARSRQVYRGVSNEDNYYEILTLGSEAHEAQQYLVERNLMI